MNNQNHWTEFTAFLSPLNGVYLFAPFGADVYEIKNFKTNELVYIGEGIHVAYRMTCLLLYPYGAGTRKNMILRNYIFENLNDIQFRTLACVDKITAKQIQDQMIANNKYLVS